MANIEDFIDDEEIYSNQNFLKVNIPGAYHLN
jgi:hypothetical protein